MFQRTLVLSLRRRDNPLEASSSAGGVRGFHDYRGRIKQGAVVLEAPIQLPDGTEVEFNTLPVPSSPNVRKKLLSLAGKADGLPEDAGKQVDHYLYGTPKR